MPDRSRARLDVDIDATPTQGDGWGVYFLHGVAR